MATTFLTPDERENYDAVPEEISHREVIQHFTLTPDDQAEIKKRRGKALKLGFALRLCQLRWLGRFPNEVKSAPASALEYLSEQLGIPRQPLAKYPEQGTTRWDHMKEIRQHLGYKEFKHTQEEALEWLLSLAIEHDFARGLLDALIEHLRREKIVRPGISTLERFVTQTRAQAREQVTSTVKQQLTEAQCQALDALLEVPADQTISQLQQLKAPPPYATANRLLTWMDKVKLCRSLGADSLDLGDLHPNRVKLLARRARRRSNTTIAQMDAPGRYALLACFLHEALYNLTDQTIEMYSQLVQRIFRRAEGKRDREFAKRGKEINDKVLMLQRVAQVILNEAEIADEQVRPAVYRQVSKERLMLALAECEELAQPSDFRAFVYSARSFRHLRAFMPKFIALMRFHSVQESDPVLEAVTYMRQLNARNRRKLVDAPTDFVPWRWKKYVVTESGEVASRAMYELCLADCLVQALNDGQLWVEHSREHTSFREDWISDVKWPTEQQALLIEFPHLADSQAFIEQMRQMLDERMASVNQQWPELEDQVKIEDGNLHLARLEAVSEPEGTEALRATLQRLLPWRTLPELLVEVNGWTDFTDHLTSLNPQEREIPNLTTRKHAAVMAQGMNIGLDNMANAVEDISYRELAWVADWYVREDTLRKAIMELINFLIQLPITQCWGDGTTSSSDGQLFGVRARALYARINPHAPHMGASMKAYFHVADNLAPYYSRLIESTTYEAPYILDALLHHETDLKIREHYADTGGYTDTLFGLCHLLGFRFAPRLRSLKERRLFRMRRNLDDYPNIQALFVDPINTRAIREGWEDLLRLTASVKTGVTSAARVLRKLNAHHPETRLYKALREVGRIAKTLFLLDYLSDQALRRRVLVGLNKGESFNSLTRALFIGQTGVLKSRAIEDQVNQISCLRLLATAVIVWNAVYMGEAVEHLRAANYQVTDEQLAHIYPMLLKRINLIGEYRFPEDERALTALDALPLRSLEGMLVQLPLGL